MKKISFLIFAILPFLGFSQEIKDSVSMLPGNVVDVYYNTVTGTKDTVRNNNWHLAFSTRRALPPFRTMQAASVRINEGRGVELFKSPFTIDEWADFDTTGWMGWNTFYNSDSTWDIGAFNQQRNVNNPFDYGWGQYDMVSKDVSGNRIWLIAISTNPNPAAPKSLKKLHIQKIVYDTMWVFTISNLDGSDSNQVSIKKTDFNGKMHAYYNVFTNQVIDREPAMNTWDLLFTRYKTLVTMYGQTLMYPVMGVLNNPEVHAARIFAPGADTLKIGGKDDSLYFSSKITTIGWDWKVITTTPGPWPIKDSLAYFLHRNGSNGDYQRLVFSSYWADQTKQDIHFGLFSYKVIPSQVNELSGMLGNLQVFPNPAKEQLNVVLNFNQEPGKIRAELVDLKGITVFSEELGTSGKVREKQINLSGISSGMYILRLVSAEGSIHSKILVD
ncbi:MAG: T9SS type A sorting domain-containing protein [Bacteroidetes bacterium]|nr:T9SS type A sorting domain-containing protein [Bacteroidota bacterium]